LRRFVSNSANTPSIWRKHRPAARRALAGRRADACNAERDDVRAGDILVVTQIDRLARSIADLAAIVRTLEQPNVVILLSCVVGT
jgi:hypothetical protein